MIVERYIYGVKYNYYFSLRYVMEFSNYFYNLYAEKFGFSKW